MKKNKEDDNVLPKPKRLSKAEQEAKEAREVESFMAMANAIVQSRKDSRNRW